ncbi:MAG TPA: hypothetical protein VGE11_18070 [Pseudonocardia sp.]
MSHQSSTGQVASPWASGLILFSGGMLVISGILQLFIAVPALMHDIIYTSTPQYAYTFNLTAWGWIQLITGIAAICAGYAALRGLTWARILGIVVSCVSIVMEFAYIPHFAVWSVLVIAIDLVIIWGLATYRPEAA